MSLIHPVIKKKAEDSVIFIFCWINPRKPISVVVGENCFQKLKSSAHEWGGGVEEKITPHYCGPFFCKNIPPLLPLFHFSFPFHKFATEFRSLWQKPFRDGEIMFHVRKKRFCDIEKNFLAVSKDSFSQTQKNYFLRQRNIIFAITKRYQEKSYSCNNFL